jgi:hypothetical protein
MKSNRPLLTPAAAAFAVLLSALPALAQDPVSSEARSLEKGQAHSDIELTRKVIETERQAIVANAIELTDAEGKAFWPLYRRYENDRAKLRDRLAELVMTYADAYPNVSTEEADRMTKAVLDIQADEIELKQDYLDDFQKVLSNVKAARFYQLENKLDAAVSMELAKSVPLIW